MRYILKFENETINDHFISPIRYTGKKKAAAAAAEFMKNYPGYTVKVIDTKNGFKTV